MSDGPLPPTAKLNEHDQLTALLAEYASVREELRTYLKEYSPKLTVVGTALTASLGWVIAKNENWGWISISLAPIALLLGHITIAQSYLVALLGARSRDIEREIATLNGGSALLKWEHGYAAKFVFEPFIGRGQGTIKWLPFLNPLHAAVAMVILTGVAIVLVSGLEGYQFLMMRSVVVARIYAAVVGLFLLIQVSQSLSFYQVGKYVDSQRANLDSGQSRV